MEVLNGTSSRAKVDFMPLSGNEKKQADLGGQSLIQTIVSLTELPGPLVHQEMNEIIQASGHHSESLTLEQLRAAMLSYLEAIQADLACDDGSLTENDASMIKTPVILE